MYSITGEQKGAVSKGIADLLFKVMRKPRGDTVVIFHEHDIKDIGQGGVPLRKFRAASAPGGEPGNS